MPKRALSYTLTPREQTLLTYIWHGLLNRESASKMGIRVRTVETHRYTMMRKMGVHGTAQLIRAGLVHGWITRKER